MTGEAEGVATTTSVVLGFVLSHPILSAVFALVFLLVVYDLYKKRKVGSYSHVVYSLEPPRKIGTCLLIITTVCWFEFTPAVIGACSLRGGGY